MTDQDMSQQIHIIYTPGSFAQTQRFLRSLLRHSPFDYTLVANGCDEVERRRMEQFVLQEPRTNLEVLEAARLLLHGVALDRLAARCRHPYFSFMDSDIFAVDDFAGSLAAQLPGVDAFFSGRPAWWATDEVNRFDPQTNAYMGQQLFGPQGRVLGTSYFALYDRAQLAACMAATGVSFAPCPWEHVPPEQRRLLTALGLRTHWYDTGKLLNILLAERGARLAYADLPALVHLGGVSRYLREKRRPSVSERWGNVRGRAHKHGWLREIQRMIHSRLMRRGEVHSPDVSDYFGALLEALATSAPLPPVPAALSPAVTAAITAITAQLADLYAQSPTGVPLSPAIGPPD